MPSPFACFLTELKLNVKKDCFFTGYAILVAGQIYLISKEACFKYVAEGSNFLKRGATHPPSFPMFHSPELKMEFE